VYNSTTGANAYIEDYYEIGLPVGSNSSENIQWKYNATTAHLEMAINGFKDQLFISFASSEHTANDPPQTPRIMALGEEGVDGVNQKLLPWLQQRKGGRFGIVSKWPFILLLDGEDKRC
jgi:1-phosphatidylinositol phosphodiesterase